MIQTLRHMHEGSDITRAHFRHHAASMNFRSLLYNPKICRDLLVQPAPYDVQKHLMFSRAKRGEALRDRVDFLSGLPHCMVALDGNLNRAKQVVSAHRLRQEVDGTRFHCLHTGGEVALPADENDRTAAAFAG